jgi:hypothetical protein
MYLSGFIQWQLTAGERGEEYLYGQENHEKRAYTSKGLHVLAWRLK